VSGVPVGIEGIFCFLVFVCFMQSSYFITLPNTISNLREDGAEVLKYVGAFVM